MNSNTIFRLLELNQIITDKVYRYRPNIFWNHKSKCFLTEKRTLFWTFINLAIYLCIVLPGCIYTLLHALYNSKNYDLFQMFAVTFQLLYSVAIFGTYVVLSHFNELVPMLNELMHFESSLTHKSTNMVCTPFKRKRFNEISTFCFHGTSFDKMSLISTGIILWYGVIPVLLTPVLIYCNMDLCFFIARTLLPLAHRNVFIKFSLPMVRFLILLCYLTEGSSTIRTLYILMVFMLTLFRKCVKQLAKGNPFFKCWYALQILFLIANNFCLYLSTIYLGVTFYIIVICAAFSVLSLGNLHWTLYIFFPAIVSITFTAIAVLFQLCVNMDKESKNLKIKWLLFCVTAFNRVDCRFKMKMFYKTWKSLQIMSFSYGPWGTITTETRTNFFYALLEYSINVILAVRVFA